MKTILFYENGKIKRGTVEEFLAQKYPEKQTVYKLFVDPKTGLATELHPKMKGDGEIGRSKY